MRNSEGSFSFAKRSHRSLFDFLFVIPFVWFLFVLCFVWVFFTSFCMQCKMFEREGTSAFALKVICAFLQILWRSTFRPKLNANKGILLIVTKFKCNFNQSSVLATERMWQQKKLICTNLFLISSRKMETNLCNPSVFCAESVAKRQAKGPHCFNQRVKTSRFGAEVRVEHQQLVVATVLQHRPVSTNGSCHNAKIQSKKI